MGVTRISWLIALVNSRRKPRERDFELRVGIASRMNAAVESARWRANAIRSAIAAGEKIDG